MLRRIVSILTGMIALIIGLTGIGVAVNADDEGAFEYDETQQTYVYSTEITVQDRKPDAVHAIEELPAFVTVMELNPDIPRFQTLPEILGRTAGVHIKDFGGMGKLATVSIRGSSANQVVVLLDGVRMNTASDSGVNLADLPLGDIEKIEVLRGADSAVFGDGAMGGVVNLITRKSGSSASGAQGSVTYGSFATLNSQVGARINNSKLKVNLQGYYNRSDGDFTFTNDNGTEPFPGDDFEDVRQNNDLLTGGGSLQWSWADMPDLWTLSGTLGQTYSDKGVPGIVGFTSEHAREIDRRSMTTLHLQRAGMLSPDGAVSLDLSGVWSGLNFDDPLGEQIGVPVHTRQRTQAVNGSLGWRFQAGPGSGAGTFQMNRENLNDADFGDPARTVLAGSGKYDLPLLDSRLWITAMARYDHISHLQDQLSPKLGLRWYVTPAVSVKTSVGTAFRSPSFNELYMNMGYVTGNPDLQPEKAFSADLGAAWETPRVRLEAAVFQTDSTDLIQYLLVSGFRYTPYNIGKARARGVEADVSWRIFSSLQVSASYTYTDAVDRSGERNYDGKQIPGRPEHDVFTRLEYSFLNCRVYGELAYLSGNYTTRANTKLLPIRRTAGAGMEWDMTGHCRLGVEIKNITNDDVVDVRGFPLPPRSAFITLNVSI